VPYSRQVMNSAMSQVSCDDWRCGKQAMINYDGGGKW
jgi:hypothetical protein